MRMVLWTIVLFDLRLIKISGVDYVKYEETLNNSMHLMNLAKLQITDLSSMALEHEE